MTALEHSPLPWQVLGQDVWDANGEGVTYGSDLPEDPEANARLIVAAVNAHADLLAAAKEVILVVDDKGSALPMLFGAIGHLRAAIAKAEEPTSEVPA